MSTRRERISTILVAHRNGESTSMAMDKIDKLIADHLKSKVLLAISALSKGETVTIEQRCDMCQAIETDLNEQLISQVRLR